MTENIIPITDGILNGTMRFHDDKGNLFLIMSFKDGQKDGYCYIYDTKTGKMIIQMLYKENELEGEKVFFNDRGALFQVENYHKGIQHGKSFTLFPSGAVQVEKIYDQGLLKSTVIYDEKGKVIQTLDEAGQPLP